MVENEIQFLSWKEFRQMAPSILRLEITRLAGLINAAPPDALDVRNTLVKARFEVQQFVACLQNAEPSTVTACTAHLQSALLNIALVNTEPTAEEATTLSYIADRLGYVIDRLAFIY